jgi:hypothetical protein
MLRHRLPLAAALLGTFAACTAEVSPPASPDAPPAGQEVVVEVRPDRVSVQPGGTVSFTSRVTGTADESVAWEVVEPDGGTVTDTGTYVAPLASGEYTVIASSKGSRTHGRGKVVVSPIAVTISPGSATVSAGGTRSFTATVTGTTETGVTWALLEASGCGSITSSGVYAAPASGATCRVVAASVANPSVTATSTVTVTPPPPPPPPAPVTVAVTPSSGAADACRTLAFTASVSGTTDGAVTWSVQEGSAGGTVTTGGVYTAPASAGTYHVVATSRAAPASSAAVAVVVAERVLGVAVSPSALSVAANGTAQLTATVTTTCGSFAATKPVTLN